MNFVIRFPISINWKNNSYKFIFILDDQLVEMIYYKPVQNIIDIPEMAKVIINVII